MELKERLAKILKNKYGIETDEDLTRELEHMPEIDFGIFINAEIKGEIKSA